ncbi:MAG: hypothetical protein WCG99_02500 [Candidatus Berkelbacteria bacterium]
MPSWFWLDSLMFAIALWLALSAIRVAWMEPKARSVALIILVTEVACLFLLCRATFGENGKDIPFLHATPPVVAMIVVLLIGLVLPMASINSSSRVWIGWWKSLFRPPVYYFGVVSYDVMLWRPRLFISGFRQFSRKAKYWKESVGYELPLTFQLTALPTATPAEYLDDVYSVKQILSNQALSNLMQAHGLTADSTDSDMDGFSAAITAMCQCLKSLRVTISDFKVKQSEVREQEFSRAASRQIWPLPDPAVCSEAIEG